MADTPDAQPKATKAELRAAADVILDRLQFMRQAGMSFEGDRDLYDALGYDRTLTIEAIRERYARGGIAARVVDALPKATWRGGLELVEDDDPKTDTEFEKAWKALDKRLKIVPKFQRIDILAGLSSYAVLLIGADGEFNTELPKGKPDGSGITTLTPFSGGLGPQWIQSNRRAISQTTSLGADATIIEFDTDTHSERFGQPLFYRLKRVGLDSPAMGVDVHWSRVIHIAEEVLDDDVYGQPALERVWNLLDDLDKVTGGGAEAFWIRANQGLNINLDKEMDLGGPNTEEAEALKAEIMKYVHGMQRVMKTRGAEVKTLGSDVADFQNPADAILTQIAGAKAIPKRILTGSEMGELASSQDRENWRDQVVGRREGYADPMIVRLLVDRLIAYGHLPEVKEYKVRFAAITTMTEEEKAAGALKWASTNKMAGMPTFTVDQIRDYWYGFEPLTPDEVKKNTIEVPEPANASGEKKKKKFPRAAEDQQSMVDKIVGGIVRFLGGAGSGNFGHAGRPGEVGGSAANSNADGTWKSSGGFEHTGITWKQPTDPKTGRAIPIKVKSVEEAAEAVLNGLVVEVTDVRTAHTLIDKLAKMAQEAKAAGKEAKDYDLCQVTVAGSNMFCVESLRTEQYPDGVPRIEMPQLGGKPIPGSEADKLPRRSGDKDEVDGSHAFITHLQGIGVKTNRETVPASHLRASQREIIGSKVGGMMTAKNYDPSAGEIFISSDNYVVDGHHRWAAVVGRDAEDGKLGDAPMKVVRVNAPISEVLHLANAWSQKFGIAQAAGVTRQAIKTGLRTASTHEDDVVTALAEAIKNNRTDVIDSLLGVKREPPIVINNTLPSASDGDNKTMLRTIFDFMRMSPRAAESHEFPSVVIHPPANKGVKKTYVYGEVNGQMRPVSCIEEPIK